MFIEISGLSGLDTSSIVTLNKVILSVGGTPLYGDGFVFDLSGWQRVNVGAIPLYGDGPFDLNKWQCDEILSACAELGLVALLRNH